MRGWFYLAFTVSTLSPFALEARVFETQSPSTLPWNRFADWRCAYEAPLVLNGSPVTLQIWNAPESLSSVCARIQNQAIAAGHTAFWLPGDDMALGAITETDRLHHLVAMQMESGRQTLIFAFTRKPHENVHATAEQIPHGIPSPPGARLRFHLHNAKSRTTTLCWDTALSPDQARQFMAGGLIQNGWQPAVPNTAGHPLALYVKGDALCAVSAELSGQDGLVLVTVLHHQMKNVSGHPALPWRASP